PIPVLLRRRGAQPIHTATLLAVAATELLLVQLQIRTATQPIAAVTVLPPAPHRTRTETRRFAVAMARPLAPRPPRTATPHVAIATHLLLVQQLIRMAIPRTATVTAALNAAARIRTATRPAAKRSNNAFKPKPLRSANHMAEKACHVLRSTTRLGLTWVLGRMELEAQPYRFKVSLRLVHPSADLSHCSREFGLEPSRQWRAGDARTTPRGRPLEGVRGE